jgi:hypothetical protein
MITANLQGLLVRIGESLKKSAREVRLRVSWQEGGSVESFEVVTHLVVSVPEER